MTECYLALGSNLNRPKQQIQWAIQALKKLPCSKVKKISALYQSIPAGGLIEPLYYNAVLLLETQLPPERLLFFCNLIEQKQKRVRLKRFHARTIDIDILFYGTKTICLPHLTIPHPRLHLRDFVLIPLLTLWPEAGLPDGTKLSESLRALATYYVI